MSTKSTPIWEIKAGKFSLSAWQHKPQNEEKANSDSQFYKLQKNYKKKSGEFVNKSFFLFANELEDLNKVVKDGMQRINTDNPDTHSNIGS
jgi:hypothetical protein